MVDDRLLIDVGEKSFLELDPEWILISHFHPDHAFFIRRGGEETPETEAPIFGPEKAIENIHLLRRRRTLGPYSIVPVPTHHSKLVRSQGYVVKRGDRSFFYTGDLVWVDKKYHARIGRVDLVITEASFLRKGGMVRKDRETGRLYGHNGIPNLLSLLKPFSPNILLMHFGSWFFKDTGKARKQLRGLASDAGVNILVGYDGFDVDLDRDL